MLARQFVVGLDSDSFSRNFKSSEVCALQVPFEALRTRTDTPALSIGRPKDKKNDDSVSLQRALEPHYIHKVDGKD